MYRIADNPTFNYQPKVLLLVVARELSNAVTWMLTLDEVCSPKRLLVTSTNSAVSRHALCMTDAPSLTGITFSKRGPSTRGCSKNLEGQGSDADIILTQDRAGRTQVAVTVRRTQQELGFVGRSSSRLGLDGWVQRPRTSSSLRNELCSTTCIGLRAQASLCAVPHDGWLPYH